jgi:hypothetical protein
MGQRLGLHRPLTSLPWGSPSRRRCRISPIARDSAVQLSGLFRQTGHRAIGTKDATVTGFWPQEHAAAHALVVVDASVRRHRFDRHVPTFGARKGTGGPE